MENCGGKKRTKKKQQTAASLPVAKGDHETDSSRPKTINALVLFSQIGFQNGTLRGKEEYQKEATNCGLSPGCKRGTWKSLKQAANKNLSLV